MRRVLPLLFACACTSSATTTGYTPVTSVVVRAESIVPSATCGKGADQIAKYTAVVSSTDSGSPVALSGGTYDCFADAMFVNLVGTSFAVDVFEWSAGAYAASGALASIEAELRDPAQVSGALRQLGTLAPTARLSCTARQLSNVQAVAQCAPLKDGGGG